MYKFGQTQRKILVALLGGVALGMSGSPRQYFSNLRKIKKEWENINQGNFVRSIKSLSKEKLIEESVLPDGSCKLILTARGKKQANKLELIGNSINFKKPKRWDGKWRLVIFDIPEKDRDFRNILRSHLRELRFFRLQNSVFISPHPFENMILELVYLYAATPYVRVITAEKIDNEDRLKRYFARAIADS